MDHRAELVDVIRSVRNRWRLRLALRGVVVVVAGTVLALLLSASGLESFRFSAGAIIAFRILTVAVFVGLLLYGFVWPLRRRVTDAQVAMYLEECDPTLEAAIISAVEATANGGSPDHSPRLVEKLVEQAIERSAMPSSDGSAVDRVGGAASRRRAGGRRRRSPRSSSRSVPRTFGTACRRCSIISRSAEASSPYSIEVMPGNTKVPRGADQAVRAKLVGFTVEGRRRHDAHGAGRAVRARAAHRRRRLQRRGTFEGMLFHLEKATEYYVESNGVRSPTVHAVGRRPADRLAARARVPLPRLHRPAAAQGRRRRRRRRDSRHRGAAAHHADDGCARRPDSAERRRRGAAHDAGRRHAHRQLQDRAQGFYRIELTGPQGEKVDASPQYTIDVIDDQAPAVRFTKPGRDTQASPVEELFLEARADDDYGVKSLQLFYSVNGGAAEDHLAVRRRQAAARSERRPHDLPRGARAQAGRLRVLLREGDRHRQRAGTEDDDQRHLLRPDPAVQEGLQAGAVAGDGRRRGGGGGQQVGELSRQQREIVAATFNIVRDKAKTKPDKFRENVVFLNLAQAKLREQVEELVGKLKARLGVVDPAFNKIAEVLPKAAEEMKSAEADLKAMKADSRAVARTARAEAAAGRRAAVRDAGGDAATAAAGAAADRARWPKISPTCSSWSSTSSPISTRCSSAPSSRAATIRSTSWSRS